MPDTPLVALAAPHYGEEPCISGVCGSGTVFFTGCNLQCVFCQNRLISIEGHGKAVSIERLAEIFRELEKKSVHNLNLVSPTQFADKVLLALEIAKPKIPVVWNSSGYETLSTLKMLQGQVQIYMPDFKYSSSKAAMRYSGVADYTETTKSAILEMYRQTGPFKMDEDGTLQKGVIIRHLILPRRLDDCFDVIDWVAETFPENSVLFSLMSQFTPLADKDKYPELSHTLSEDEYNRAIKHLSISGIERGYCQELRSATVDMIPSFDFSGL